MTIGMLRRGNYQPSVKGSGALALKAVHVPIASDHSCTQVLCADLHKKNYIGVAIVPEIGNTSPRSPSKAGHAILGALMNDYDVVAKISGSLAPLGWSPPSCAAGREGPYKKGDGGPWKRLW